MKKYLSWKRKIINKLEKKQIKYNFDLQLVNNINANGCVILFDKKYLIFINEKVDNKLLPLVILHEIGHIKFKTLLKNPKKYSYWRETLSNIYAISNLLFLFNFIQKLKILFLTIVSEDKLYNFFVNNNKLGGNYIYEWISNNQ